MTVRPRMRSPLKHSSTIDREVWTSNAARTYNAMSEMQTTNLSLTYIVQQQDLGWGIDRSSKGHASLNTSVITHRIIMGNNSLYLLTTTERAKSQLMTLLILSLLTLKSHLSPQLRFDHRRQTNSGLALARIVEWLRKEYQWNTNSRRQKHEPLLYRSSS